MKLHFTRQIAGQTIVGAQVALLRNDIEGGSLAIQTGNEILIIRLSNIVNLINEQEKPEVDLVDE